MMVKPDAKNSTKGIFVKTIFDILIENLRPILNIMVCKTHSMIWVLSSNQFSHSQTEIEANEGTALERGKRNYKGCCKMPQILAKPSNISRMMTRHVLI